MFVSPIKLPTPAQRKIKVHEWLEQDTDKDDTPSLPRLDSVRQTLSFHNDNLESSKNIASGTYSLASFNPRPNDNIETKPTIPLPEQKPKQVNYRNCDSFGYSKMRKPNNNKVVNDPTVPTDQLPGNVAASHHKTQEEDKQTFHIDDDELLEFQQIEEEVELDEFAEVEAMVNEGHVAEAGEELLHGIHLTDDQHSSSQNNHHHHELDLKMNVTSLSHKASGSKPTTQEHRQSRLPEKLGRLQTKQGSSKLTVNNPKRRSNSTTRVLCSIGKASEKTQGSGRSTNHTYKLEQKSMLPTSSNITKQKQSQRSIRPPSNLAAGVRNSYNTKKPQVKVNGSAEVDEDESWKEGCF